MALKVYILYSFFCTTFLPPRSDGQRVPLHWRGRWLGCGARRRAPTSRFPTHVVGGGRATGIAKLPPSSQPPTRGSLQQLTATGQALEMSLGVGVNGNPLLRAESCTGGAPGGFHRDTFTLEKPDRAVREPILRTSTGDPGNPNQSLSSQTSLEGCFPQRGRQVHRSLRFKQHPRTSTCKGVLELGKGLAPLDHTVNPKLRAEDAGANPGDRQGRHQRCSPLPWVHPCLKCQHRHIPQAKMGRTGDTSLLPLPTAVTSTGCSLPPAHRPHLL